jgi:hypothetical protein
VLGFDVEDMDQVFPQGSKREDLRVRTSDRPDWVAILEARTYPGGVRLSDVLYKLGGRFRSEFERDELRPPDAMWFVANQFRDDDPRTRTPPLHGHPGELSGFAEDGGLVIDSGELFRLWMAVERGEMPSSIARDRLMDAAGVFLRATT